jgi:predicted unusual protein kinase regulating ubiquinone biosynthesis (AarF/ABC1/UbiB family)
VRRRKESSPDRDRAAGGRLPGPGSQGSADDGTWVALKVRRPGIRPVVEADLRLLKRLAEIIESEAPDLKQYRPKALLRQFSESLRAELDFAAEGRQRRANCR